MTREARNRARNAYRMTVALTAGLRVPAGTVSKLAAQHLEEEEPAKKKDAPAKRLRRRR